MPQRHCRNYLSIRKTFLPTLLPTVLEINLNALVETTPTLFINNLKRQIRENLVTKITS